MPTDSYYTVEHDDCVLDVAYRHGFHWKTIWNHSKNAPLRDLRKEPNVLLAGDQVFIPEPQLRFESRNTEKRHTFRRKGIPARARFRFLDGGEPRKDVPYILTIDGKSVTGRTDADGALEVAVPPDARHGTLVLSVGDEAEHYELALGRMDPVSEIRGACMRLQSLGFISSDDDEDEEACLVGALQSFQQAKGLEITGKLDEKTKHELQKAFGC